jgi:Ca2+/Na+ antiporter
MPGDTSTPDAISVKLALYSTAVEMADRMSARRAGANTFFFTLHAGLAAIVGIVSAARKRSTSGSSPTFDSFGLVMVAIAGLTLAMTWWLLLRYYRRLSQAKYAVINEMEKAFPVQPYTDEWKLLHPDETIDTASLKPERRLRWWKPQKHREATAVEQLVPAVFACIYIVLGARVLVG